MAWHDDCRTHHEAQSTRSKGRQFLLLGAQPFGFGMAHGQVLPAEGKPREERPSSVHSAYDNGKWEVVGTRKAVPGLATWVLLPGIHIGERATDGLSLRCAAVRDQEPPKTRMLWSS